MRGDELTAEHNFLEQNNMAYLFFSNGLSFINIYNTTIKNFTLASRSFNFLRSSVQVKTNISLVYMKRIYFNFYLIYQTLCEEICSSLIRDFFIQEVRYSFKEGIFLSGVKNIEIYNGTLSDPFYTSVFFAVFLSLVGYNVTIRDLFVEFNRWRCSTVFIVSSTVLLFENVTVTQDGGADLPCLVCKITSGTTVVVKNILLKNLGGSIDEPSIRLKNG